MTPESVYINRRKFIKDLGIAGAGAISLFSSTAYAQDSRSDYAQDSRSEKQLKPYREQRLKHQKNETFTVTRPQTDEIIAATYNNFYEFSSGKTNVWKWSRGLKRVRGRLKYLVSLKIQ